MSMPRVWWLFGDPLFLLDLGAVTTHIEAVAYTMPLGTPCSHRYSDMTSLTVCLQAVTSAFVPIVLIGGQQNAASLTGLAFYREPISVSVCGVLLWRVPTQIVQSVIGAIRVWIVTGLTSDGAGSHECFEYEPMNLFRNYSTIYIQAYAKVTTPPIVEFHGSWFFTSASGAIIAPFAFLGPDASVGAHEVTRQARAVTKLCPIHITMLRQPTSTVKYDNQRAGQDNENKHRERLWASPNCLMGQGSLL